MKNSEGKMKKVFTGFILLTVLFLLAACDNDPQDQPQTDNAAPTAEPALGMGRLTVELDGTDGRTLLPETPVFSRYALTFSYLDGASEINRTADSLPFSIELLPGNWRVSVTGYVYIEDVEGILDGDYPVASGEETVYIAPGVTTPVTVDLYRENTGVEGIFQYDIGLPEDVLSNAVLNILRIDRSLLTTRDLLEAASGSIALDEGYYFVQVRVVTGRVRSKTELIHIYSGHITVATGAAWDFDTEEGVYLSLAELSTFLSSAPVNTADNPYPVKLITDWAALSKPDEFLGQMYDALNGRYVNVDLSEATNVDGIFNTTSYSYTSNRFYLVSIILPEGLTAIGERAFHGCDRLTSVTIGNSVASIGDSAFRGCTRLSGVTIPDSVTSIGNNAFEYCTRLTGVIIGNSVTSIGESAFSGCTGLTGVTIPDSVTSIGSAAFGNCTNLTVTIQTGNITTTQTSNWGTIFSSNTALSVILGNGITSITDYAFRNCTGLAGVTIANSITSIGNSAFSGCTGLTTITIPDSVTGIGSSAFSGCTGLTGVTIGNSVTGIGSSAFSGCTGLTTITIPDSVTRIESSAFSGCTGLTNVTIGNSVTSIALGYGEAFAGCTGLKAINVVPENTVYNSVDGILYNKNITSLRRAPQGITGTVTIPDSVTTIEYAAFSGCTGLTGVTIGNSVTSIGSNLFGGCTGLTSVTIGNGVTSIGSDAFDSCTALQAINVASNNTVYNSVDGILYNKSLSVLIMAGQGITGTITIPDSVTGIGNNAFRNCNGPIGITIPDSVASIGSSAFDNCKNLTVTIQTNKISTWSDAFSNNTALSVIFGDGVTSIGNNAFSGCTGLTGVTIPDSVASIGNYAFDGCSRLTNVIFNGTITSSGFSSTSTFPGDLRTKYLDEGPGLYFTSNPGSNAVWHRSPSITAPVWTEGNAVSLDAPAIALPAGQTVTAQGWQISDTGSGGWANFTPPATADMYYHGKYLRYYAVSNGETYYSNTVVVVVSSAVGSIVAPAWRVGITISLTAPSVYLETVIAQGWQISDTGSGGWSDFMSSTADMSDSGKYLRYYATNSIDETYYSNTVTILVFVTDEYEVTIAMWADTSAGWFNGAALRINVNGTNLATNASLANGRGPSYYTFSVNSGNVVQIYWVGGDTYDNVMAFAVYYSDDPPNPAFNPSMVTTDGRVLIYKRYRSPLNAVGNGTLMGSFTVP